MKRIFSVLTVICLSAVLSGVSFAQSKRTPGVTKRQVTQQKRIRQGVRNDDLTRREVRRLEKEQRSINRLKKRAKSDGEVTRRERARIHREQNEANRHIYRAKHNNRKRP